MHGVLKDPSLHIQSCPSVVIPLCPLVSFCVGKKEKEAHPMLTSVIVGNLHFLFQFISLSKFLAFAWLDEGYSWKC